MVRRVENMSDVKYQGMLQNVLIVMCCFHG